MSASQIFTQNKSYILFFSMWNVRPVNVKSLMLNVNQIYTMPVQPHILVPRSCVSKLAQSCYLMAVDPPRIEPKYSGFRSRRHTTMLSRQANNLGCSTEMVERDFIKTIEDISGITRYVVFVKWENEFKDIEFSFEWNYLLAKVLKCWLPNDKFFKNIIELLCFIIKLTLFY